MNRESVGAEKPSADVGEAQTHIKPKQVKAPSRTDLSVAAGPVALGPPSVGHDVPSHEVSTDMTIDLPAKAELATIDMADLEKLRRWLQEQTAHKGLYPSDSLLTARELGLSVPFQTHTFDRHLPETFRSQGSLVWKQSPWIYSSISINRSHASETSVQQIVAHNSQRTPLCELPDTSDLGWPFAEVPQS